MNDERDVRQCVVVVTGAAALSPVAIDAIPATAFVVAADGGLDHALAAGLSPDVLIGDLDSVSVDARTWAEANAEVVAHPADKAATDTELALAHAASLGPRRVMMLAGAGAGDRVDHTIAAIGALGSAATSAVPEVTGWWGSQRLHIVRPDRPLQFDAEPGATFSVLALHGPSAGVDVTGARWPLIDADVGAVVGLGVSNEVATSPVTVAVRESVLTVIISGGHQS